MPSSQSSSPQSPVSVTVRPQWNKVRDGTEERGEKAENGLQVALSRGILKTAIWYFLRRWVNMLINSMWVGSHCGMERQTLFIEGAGSRHINDSLLGQLAMAALYPEIMAET